jgi:serine carboxypeptidase-like clade II
MCPCLCVRVQVQDYLQRHDVQVAIHANLTLPWNYSECSSVVQYSRQSLLSSMLPVYDFLVQSKIKMLVFSGDVDAIVPVTGTMTWLSKLGLEIVAPKRPWYVNNQVGGRVTEYNGLTFTTIRNAGHMVRERRTVAGLRVFLCVLSCCVRLSGAVHTARSRAVHDAAVHVRSTVLVHVCP